MKNEPISSISDLSIELYSIFWRCVDGGMYGFAIKGGFEEELSHINYEIEQAAKKYQSLQQRKLNK